MGNDVDKRSSKTWYDADLLSESPRPQSNVVSTLLITQMKYCAYRSLLYKTGWEDENRVKIALKINGRRRVYRSVRLSDVKTQTDRERNLTGKICDNV